MPRHARRAAGQFAAAPLIHGPLAWQQFWLWSGVVILVIAVAMFIVTPREDRSQGAKASIWSTFAPYKTVLANPQTYLCGLCAGLLFLPTTVGAMTWGVSLLEHGWHRLHARGRSCGGGGDGRVFGCPILGYLADYIGRRKPIVLAGAALMLVAMLAINYLPPETFPPYVLGFVLGFGSGAGMIPYLTVKEVNPDYAKGSATGAMNFLVFVLSALLGPAFGALLQKLADGGALSLDVFVKANGVFVAAIVVAAILAFFLEETG